MSCPHISQLANIPNPRLSQSVHREECTLCFDNQDLPEGIDVCLTCFNGGCVNDDPERRHAQLHYQKSGHPFTLNIRRRAKPRSKRDSGEPPLKRLAIVEEREEDKYEHEVVLRCWSCDNNGGRLLPEAASDAQFQRLSTAVMHSMSSARQSEVKAWEEEITPCEHTLMLQQDATGPIAASGLAHCTKCELKENLWLCLTCGSLGCGRQQFGGIGGNGHGLKHYEETGHPVAVKLGTITPEGGADIFCYKDGDSKLDPDLAFHLSTFGINVATQSKTEKSITELQIEQNLKFDFSMTGEDGKALQPLFGPGLTGLSNLGNSCYMASTLQTIFALPAFRTHYLKTAASHPRTCTELLPAACVDCQMRKIADGLLSGRYSTPRSDPTRPVFVSPTTDAEPEPVFQAGVKPGMFKALVGKGHEEFSTMRQQDAEEFFGHLLKVLRQHSKKVGAGEDPTDIFRFAMEQRLQCTECGGVRYRTDEHDDLSVAVPAIEDGKDEEGKTKYKPVELEHCLEGVTGVEEIDYTCPRCNKNVVARKRTLFATFPEVLVVHAKKFQLVNWVPAKLDIPITLPPSDTLTLDKYLSKGLQEGEEPLPDDAATADAALPTFNEAALGQLQAMGFPLIRCQKALLATGNADAEAAMEWLFGHMDDPDIDAPIQPAAATSKPASDAPPELVSMLGDMGFTPAQARKALRETDNNVERAVEWLFSHPDDMGEDAPTAAATTTTTKSHGGSPTLPATYRLKAFISHKGPSVHSGHYVAHIRGEDGEWVLFNDEKVVKADRESVESLKGGAYLYVWERA
ncbi:hypothetical protein M422DRAFT_206385 [Sphaerobolus stellatus SS14]|uniref:Ubiquitin carboxyl-terminal hydrolase n=1 Tax=Sphaerobolus stellatus (strain SS14) TaxID=990650 RepID=A0A0C9W341_SPHS4|nr:hypothetical protein M422DRAFT_206385 [Sphaerobolus stellatus SS14]